jgi:methylisocitrate lyase
MLHDATPATDKRAAFSAALASGELLRFPGAFSPLSAMLMARHHFDGVYVSGAVIAADLGLPHLDLTTLTEVAERTGQIARVTPLPALADAGAGSGEPMSTARTVQILEDAGVAGMRISDRLSPLKAGPAGGLASRDSVLRHIVAAVAARRDPGFVIAAGTAAAAVGTADAAPGGLAGAIDRAQAYADAGADLICPEGITAAAGFERFRAEVDEPLLVDMTEFGRESRTPLDIRTLRRLGVNVAIYPALLLQLAMAAADDGLAQLAADGTLDPASQRDQVSGLLGYLLQGTSDTCIHDLVG